MFSKFFGFTFFVLLALSTVFVNSGYTHDAYPADFDLPGSTYADVEGSIYSVHLLYPDRGQEIHIHGIVYSFDDDKVDGGHANGNYTLVLIVEAPEAGLTHNNDKEWWEDDFGANKKKEVPHVDSFTDGCRVEDNITFTAKNLGDVRAVEYRASANVKNGVGSDSDFIKKPVGEYNEESGNVNNNIVPSDTGISLASSSQMPQPGNSVTLDLVTSEPYYSVSWYVKTPWDTSETGTYLEDDYGDGTSTTASLTYVFPSGTMHTGDFIFAADIYRWVDMSWQSKETYLFYFASLKFLVFQPSYPLNATDNVFAKPRLTPERIRMTEGSIHDASFTVRMTPSECIIVVISITTRDINGIVI